MRISSQENKLYYVHRVRTNLSPRVVFGAPSSEIILQRTRGVDAAGGGKWLKYVSKSNSLAVRQTWETIFQNQNFGRSSLEAEKNSVIVFSNILRKKSENNFKKKMLLTCALEQPP